MSISLTAQGYGCLRKLLAQRCPKCSMSCPMCNRFCSWCGTENPHFDEVDLQYKFGQTLSEARDEVCKAGHPVAVAENWQTEYPEMPYCSLCGEKLY